MPDDELGKDSAAGLHPQDSCHLKVLFVCLSI